jgi:hypothetical protein
MCGFHPFRLRAATLFAFLVTLPLSSHLRKSTKETISEWLLLMGKALSKDNYEKTTSTRIDRPRFFKEPRYDNQKQHWLKWLQPDIELTDKGGVPLALF